MNELIRHRKKQRKGIVFMHLETLITKSSISYMKKQNKASDWINSNGF